MKHLIYLVNPSFISLHRLIFDTAFREGPNYSKPSVGLASSSRLRAVHSLFLADCRNRMALARVAR